MIEHEISGTNRRSLAERCYSLWRHAPEPSETARELFFAQCYCGSTGAIRQELHHAPLKTVFWTPRDVVVRDGAQCPAVAKAIAHELTAALEAATPESISVDEQRRLANEFRLELEKKFGFGVKEV